MLVLGVDPGVTGALVLVDDVALQVIDLFDIPLITDGAMSWVDGALVGDWLDSRKIDIAVIERVQYWAQDKAPGRTSVMVGIARGMATMLSASAIPSLLCTPKSWKQRAGLTRDTVDPKVAAVAMARAKLRWPDGGLSSVAKHHNRADAALIALYGRAPPVPLKAPRRSKAVDRRAAENVPPGLLFGVEP